MDVKAVLGIVRHILTFGGGYFVGSGLVTNDEMTTAISAVVSLIGLGWSIYDKRINA